MVEDIDDDISHRSQHIREAGMQKSICCFANTDLDSAVLRGWFMNPGPHCSNGDSPSPRFSFAAGCIKGVFKANTSINFTLRMTDTSPLGTRQTTENLHMTPNSHVNNSF